MHGGLSPDLQQLSQIQRIMRPTDVPDQGLLCDLLWSDPDKDVQGWGENDRGVSYTFGADVVARFLDKHDLDLVCRAHQVVEELRVFRQAAAGHRLLGAQLLRRVRQRGCDDERRREPHVLLPDPQAGGEATPGPWPAARRGQPRRRLAAEQKAAAVAYGTTGSVGGWGSRPTQAGACGTRQERGWGGSQAGHQDSGAGATVSPYTYRCACRAGVSGGGCSPQRRGVVYYEFDRCPPGVSITR